MWPCSHLLRVLVLTTSGFLPAGVTPGACKQSVLSGGQASTWDSTSEPSNEAKGTVRTYSRKDSLLERTQHPPGVEHYHTRKKLCFGLKKVRFLPLREGQQT